MPETVAPLSVRSALRAASERLRVAGCESPRLDAEILLAHVLGCDRAGLVLRATEDLPESAFWELVERRAAREPVAYIVGRREFRWITLSVDRRVLIPRPETELLVEVGLGLPSGSRVLDVGTGSGAVALALKHERPDLVVTASDSSEDALAVARANAARLNLAVEFVHGDLFGGVGPSSADAVLANLPYVPDRTELPPEIARYEPADALFAGPDGLDLLRRLVASLPGAVSWCALEVGFDQADAVSGLLEAAGFPTVRRHRDLAGHERVVVGERVVVA